MALEKYNIDCSHVDNVEDLAKLLNSMNLTYTRDPDKRDADFDHFKSIGVITSKVSGTEVSCNLCSHKFATAFTHTEVECPNCGNKSYADPDEN